MRLSEVLDLIEAHLDGPLVGCTGVLESEGHGGIAVRTKRRDERCLDLVIFLQGYLMIARVTSRKESSSQPAVESTSMSIRGRPKGSLR